MGERRVKRLAVGLYVVCFAGGLNAACNGWDPRRPFDRSAPDVETAISDLDGGKPEAAEALLEKYLETGTCKGDGGLALNDIVREKSNGAFDLGLTLFNLAERYGKPFGDEESDGGVDRRDAHERSAEIDCVLPFVLAIADDPTVAPELRARAYYLAGNLEFMRRRYGEAVELYDKALAIVPGLVVEAGGDGIGRDAAHNRTLALRRLFDKDAGDDGGADADASQDAPSDAGDKGDSGDGGDQGDKGDAGKDGGDKPNEPNDPNDPQRPPPEPKPIPVAPVEPSPGKPDPKSDDRILEELDKQPTYQQEEAKQRPRHGQGRPMEDK